MKIIQLRSTKNVLMLNFSAVVTYLVMNKNSTKVSTQAEAAGFCYLSHESEESCHHSNRVTGLLGISHIRPVATVEESGPLIEGTIQRFI